MKMKLVCNAILPPVPSLIKYIFNYPKYTSSHKKHTYLGRKSRFFYVQESLPKQLNE